MTHGTPRRGGKEGENVGTVAIVTRLDMILALNEKSIFLPLMLFDYSVAI